MMHLTDNYGRTTLCGLNGADTIGITAWMESGGEVCPERLEIYGRYV